jgi:hypothetical protein
VVDSATAEIVAALVVRIRRILFIAPANVPRMWHPE